jgi:hypothetical protein
MGVECFAEYDLTVQSVIIIVKYLINAVCVLTVYN